MEATQFTKLVRQLQGLVGDDNGLTLMKRIAEKLTDEMRGRQEPWRDDDVKVELEEGVELYADVWYDLGVSIDEGDRYTPPGETVEWEDIEVNSASIGIGDIFYELTLEELKVVNKYAQQLIR